MLDFQARIRELYARREFRPVGIYVLYDVQQRFLLCQSAKNLSYWGFPQGGIESGETLEENMHRELREELGIDTLTELEKVVYGFHYAQLPHEQERVEKRGFSRGKAYFCSAARYAGKGTFRLQREEIERVQWYSFSEAISYFHQGRKEKAVLLQDILHTFLITLRPASLS